MHSRLEPEELCPLLLGVGRGIYILLKVLPFFFPLAKFQSDYSWHQATHNSCHVVSLEAACDLSEMQDATREYMGEEECQVQGVIYMESQST